MTVTESDTETVVNFEQDSDSDSIGSASTFIRRATNRSSLRSEYSTLDLSLDWAKKRKNTQSGYF